MQRPNSYSRRSIQTRPKNKSTSTLLKIASGALLILIGFFSIQYHLNHRYSDSPNIKLASSGYCLDDFQNRLSNSNLVEAWGCNSSRAQIWTVKGINIVHDNKYCLSVVNNAKNRGSMVVMDPCNGSSGQIWLRDKGGYRNPNSALCLSASLNSPNQSLFIDSCNNLNKSVEIWSPVSSASSTKILNTSCSGLTSQGLLIACYAEREWTTWQSGSILHVNLLASYTDGSPNEEWCADFISYVYKEAGYPFTQGAANGWDENNANNIQYMSFTLHQASSGYVPRPGDVAYFSYNGGHVEIVIAGGQHPTFIYGDSATIDLTTGNGQMEANTILGNSTGQLVYYLSPK